jgi:hypothetical protein
VQVSQPANVITAKTADDQRAPAESVTRRPGAGFYLLTGNGHAHRVIHLR